MTTKIYLKKIYFILLFCKMRPVPGFSDTYTFNWIIENLQLCILSNDNITANDIHVESQIFSLRTIEKTTWNLKLSNSDQDSSYLDCTLTRYDTNELVEEVWFNMKLSIIGEKEETIYEIQEENVSLSSGEQKVVAKFIDKMLLHSNYIVQNNLNIVLVITLCSNMYDAPVNTNFDTENLSIDLQKLFENHAFSDLTLLTTDGEHIKTHKIVISNRWPRLVKHIRTKEIPEILPVNFSASTVKAILNYAYCGKLASSHFNFAVFKAAQETRIEKLVDHYAAFPNKLCCVNKINVKKVSLRWLLCDGDLHNEFSKSYSQEIILGNFVSRILIELRTSKCILNGKTSQFFKVTFNFSVSPTFSVYLMGELTFFIDEQNILHSQKLHHTFKEEFPLLTHFFYIERKLLLGKNMTLACAITIGDDIFRSKIISYNVDISNALPDLINTIQLLPPFMQNIMTSPDFTDVILNCGSLLFKGHAAILSCRSERFYEILLKFRHKSPFTIYVTDLEQSILEILLYYIYGAEIQDEKIQSNAHLLSRACDSYKILGLKHKCLPFIS